MNYQEKYLKYKNKYLQLKNQSGGASYDYRRDNNVKININVNNPNNLTAGDEFDFEGDLLQNNVVVARAFIHYKIQSKVNGQVTIQATTKYVYNKNNQNNYGTLVFSGDIISPDFDILNGVVQNYKTFLKTLTSPNVQNPSTSLYHIIGNGMGNVNF